MKIRFGQICRLYDEAITKATRNSLSGSDRFLWIAHVACANEQYNSYFLLARFNALKSYIQTRKQKYVSIL